MRRRSQGALRALDVNARHLTLPPHQQGPPSNDNDQLWKTLRIQKISGYMKDTASSRHRSTGASTTSQSVTSQASRTSTDTKKARMRDTNFRERVLLPRQILFPSTTESSDAFAHFETELPFNGYGTVDQMLHTKVWIPINNQLVNDAIREFNYIRNEQLCEAEFATYAKETLLRRDPRHPNYGEARQ